MQSLRTELLSFRGDEDITYSYVKPVAQSSDIFSILLFFSLK